MIEAAEAIGLERWSGGEKELLVVFGYEESIGKTGLVCCVGWSIGEAWLVSLYVLVVQNFLSGKRSVVGEHNDVPKWARIRSATRRCG